jgi:hypothetical protein
MRSLSLYEKISVVIRNLKSLVEKGERCSFRNEGRRCVLRKEHNWLHKGLPYWEWI